MSTSRHDDKPLTARGVLASGLLGLDPPETNVAHLVRLAELFDINENRARVALSRMVAAGEAASDGDGRYRLDGALLDRQVRQRISRIGATTSWNGDWKVLVIAAGSVDAKQRRQRRRQLQTQRFGERREGVWMRPANVAVEIPEWVRGNGEVITGPIESDPKELAEQLWDLAEWSGQGQRLLERLRTTDPAEGETLAAGFVLSASVLRHLQADPLLPAALLPTDWPGQALRQFYDSWDRRYRRQLNSWHRQA